MTWPPTAYPLRADWPDNNDSDQFHAADMNDHSDTVNDTVAKVVDVVDNLLPAKQPLSARGAANGYAPLGADSKVPASYLPSGGGGGGSLDTFDYWENWANNSNGAPTTAESGQTYIATTAGSTGAALTVSSGKLVSPHTAGGVPVAGYLTAPLGNPGLYFEAEFQFTGTGTDTVTICFLLTEGNLPGGSGGVGSVRAPMHWIFTPTYSSFQIADTSFVGSPVVDLDIEAYTTPTGVRQKCAVAIDPANNRAVVVYPNGNVRVIEDTVHSFFRDVDGNYVTQEILYQASNTDKRAEILAARASAVIGGDNIEYASKYDMLIAIGRVISEGGSVGQSLVYAPPPTGVEATDTAAIQAAHDALPAGGGTIWLQPGIYLFTSTGVTFTKKVHLIGAGTPENDGTGVTVIGLNTTNGTAITVNVEGCILEDFGISNVNGGTQTGGAGIRMQKAHQSKISRVWIYNCYDNISYESGYYWSLTDSILLSPWRYGVRIRNSDHNDSGDMNIVGCWFDHFNVTRNSTAHVRWETGSGLRLLGCKFNGSDAVNRVATHVDIAFDAGSTAVQNSADVFIQNCSIENPSSTGIKIARAAGTYALYEVMVQGNEFMTCPTAVSVGQSIEEFLVSGNVILNSGGSSVGIDLLSGSGAGTVGRNRFNGVTTPVRVNSGASKNLVVDRQDVVGDGKVVVCNLAGVAGLPRIEYDYSRPIDWTVNATPTAIFTLLPVNNTGGLVDVLVTGTSATDGGFVAGRKFAYTVNGSGTVTVTDVQLIQQPGTDPTITATLAANSITVKFSTADAAAVTNGTARIRVDGLVSEFRIGA